MRKEYRLTREGVSELQDELDQLMATKPEIAEKIRLAREQGDLTENAEYQISKDELSRVETRISEIEHILANVEVISESKKAASVSIGTKVELKNGGKPVSYTIVGSVEADPLELKISDESPIGRALMGKKVGDKAEINTPHGTTTYTITSIS